MDGTLKVVVSTASDVAIDKLVEFIHEQVLGRYKNDARFRNCLLPHFELAGYRGYIKGSEKPVYAIYETDAAQLNPAYISVMDALKKFGALDYTFQLDGTPVAVKWRPDAEDMLAQGHDTGFEESDEFGKVNYDAQAAEYADDIYQARILF